MPERYDEIKAAFERRGASPEDAKMHAAKIYQATRKPGEPELNHYVAEEKKKEENK